MYREGTMKQFTDFPISQPLLKACNELGFVNPTQIQLQAFDVLLGNPRRDFHGQAQTGTGKTLAFGIPLLQNIDSKNSAVQAL